jgi:predicted transcriptional regulator of viral defense system
LGNLTNPLTQEQQQRIRVYFETLGTKIYSRRDIEEILTYNRGLWDLPRNIRMPDLLDHVVRHLALKKIILTSPNYDRKYVRYAWGEISVYQLGLSLRPRSYLSHHSAMYLNDLTEVPSKTIYVNSEQFPKFRDETSLEQRSIDLAFKSKPRTSKYIFAHKNWKICCLSGLNKNNLAVVEIETPNSGKLQVTDIERTLIDIAVRPFYSGSTSEVQRAYIKARGKISVDRLVSILRKIDYIYPYHQVIGFYMDRAGFENSALNSLKRMGLKYDFYLDYGMVQADYSKEWRVYFPRNLRTRY